MTKDLSDSVAQIADREIDALADEALALRSVIERLKPKDPVATRIDAILKAGGPARYGKLLQKVEAVTRKLWNVPGADLPRPPGAVSAALQTLHATVEREVKALGTGGPFPQSQAAIRAAVSVHEQHAGIARGAAATAGSDLAKLKSWAQATGRAGDNALRLVGALEALSKEAAKTPRKADGQSLVKVADQLLSALESAAKACRAAANRAEEIRDEWIGMAEALAETAGEMKTATFLAGLVAEAA